MPSRVQDEMSMISSQKFSCAAGQRYLLVRTTRTSMLELAIEAIVAA
jgi:hypothetical protein